MEQAKTEDVQVLAPNLRDRVASWLLKWEAGSQIRGGYRRFQVTGNITKRLREHR